MSDQYIGEIRYFTYMRGAPSGWLLCDGSTPSIGNYQTLYTLIGTTYGGDGQNTFGLPDLRGRVLVGAGAGNPLGNLSGQETVTLNSANLPPHYHNFQASVLGATSTDPTNNVFAAATEYSVQAGTTTVGFAGNAIGSSGQGLPHENCAPTLALLPCICFEGVWPQNPN